MGGPRNRSVRSWLDFDEIRSPWLHAANDAFRRRPSRGYFDDVRGGGAVRIPRRDEYVVVGRAFDVIPGQRVDARLERRAKLRGNAVDHTGFGRRGERMHRITRAPNTIGVRTNAPEVARRRIDGECERERRHRLVAGGHRRGRDVAFLVQQIGIERAIGDLRNPRRYPVGRRRSPATRMFAMDRPPETRRRV